MIKKISIVSMIVLIVVLVTGALLAPLAVADVMEATAEIDAAYSQMEERLVIPADGVSTASFDEGYYIRYLRVKVSPDEDIHLYSNDYIASDSSFSYSVGLNTGHLEIGRYYNESSFRRGFTWISRENLPVLLAEALSDSTAQVELYLPAGVAYDLDSWAVGSTTVETGVETYRATETGDYNDITISDPVEDDWDEWEEETLEDSLYRLDAEQLRQQTLEAAEKYDERLIEAAMTYYEDGDENTFWEIVEPMYERLASLYDAQLGRSTDDESAGYYDDFCNYFSVQLQKSLRTLEQQRLEAQWQENAISKADFYEQDLELDDDITDLSADLAAIEGIRQLLDDLEINNGKTTAFVQGFALHTTEDGSYHIQYARS